MHMQNNVKRSLLGIGLDNDDGHVRHTQAEQFVILGGSEETHDRMTETIVKTVEDLGRSGRSLDDAGHGELAELLAKNTPG